jgi:hypothetical protein
MVDYLPRSAWNARPARSGPGLLTVSRVEGVVIHWPGMGDRRLSSQAAIAAALRGWQDYHMDVHDWSDIAYQVAVDQAGRAWDLRGLWTQSGANGDNDVNERYGAILLVLGTGEHPTPAMIATTRAVVDDFRELYPRGTAIRPHSAVRPEPTDCPGDLARELIAHGAFDPDAPIGTPTHPQEDEMTPAQMTELKNFIEARTQAYAKANNEYTRQVLSSTAKALMAADAASDKAQADRILAELEDEAKDLAAATLKAVPAAEVEQAS